MHAKSSMPHLVVVLSAEAFTSTSHLIILCPSHLGKTTCQEFTKNQANS